MIARKFARSLLLSAVLAILAASTFIFTSCAGKKKTNQPIEIHNKYPNPGSIAESPAFEAEAPRIITGEWLVNSVDAEFVTAWAKERGISARVITPRSGGEALVLIESDDTVMIEAIEGIEGVFFVAERRLYPALGLSSPTFRSPLFLPDDPLFVESDVDDSTEPPTLIPYQKASLEPVSVEGAWDFARGADVKIAIISSGVYSGHPELSGKISPLSRSFTESGGDVEIGTNVDDELPSVTGAIGTYLAGLIAAEMNNSVGMAGIAPECELLVLKAGHIEMTPDPNWVMSDLEVFEALRYAADEEVAAVLLPLAFLSLPEDELLIEDALYYCLARGVSVVVPAGDATAPGNVSAIYPANSSASNVLPVGGLHLPPEILLQATGQFSNVDPSGEIIGLAAPGFALITTDPRPEDPDANPPITGYVYVTGTAMSAGVVAGTLALMADALDEANSSPSLMIPLIVESVDSWNYLGVSDPLVGAGRVNISRSVARAYARVNIPLSLIINSMSTVPPQGKNATRDVPVYLKPIVGSGTPPYKVRMDWGDGITFPPGPGFSRYVQGVFGHIYTETGEFPVTIIFRDSAGQEKATSAVFSVLLPLTAVVSAEAHPSLPRQFIFSAIIANPDTTEPSYFWDFDGDWEFESFEQNPIYTYDEDGVYEVNFMVKDGRGPVSRTFDLTVG